MELTLYKAKTVNEDDWIESMTISKGTTKRKSRDLFMETNENRWKGIKPETLSIYTGLNAEWFSEGLDPRIWSGDVFEVNHSYKDMTQYKVVYKNAAFYVMRVDDEEIEKLLFNFIDNNVYTKIGSIHDQK